ncbi:MAG: nicotinate phosphoribosyltransferase, partial [Abditibacteriota bacterium]|nr:nicotinate phosphoribosyltransferase [Abditibacteriota bacterium]
MSHLNIYGGSLSLLNDLYQLTMAYGYWREGVAERESVFHLNFRRNPFDGGFALSCGLNVALDWIEHFSFSPEDCAYLATLEGNDGKPLFDAGFLKYLGALKLECSIDAIEEGEVVFAHEPLLRVQGPVLHCQLVETALLNIINFQTLIATKAARVNLAARGEAVLEFGARRAQSIDGALSASRAAYIGGCAATSNVLAGKLFNIPVRGTHAHAWVMLWGDEVEAFEAYARVMPNNCTFLVDTYDSLEGVRHAIQVGLKLKERGHWLAGIRLDSGDLAWLSQQARAMLDDAGFADAAIVGSNDLDENLIASLKEQGCRINVWGVGTRLITGGDQAALGGVYKLSAVRENGQWQPRLKLSEQTIKISNPVRLQVRRFSRQDENIADVIYDIDTNLDDGCVIVSPTDPLKRTPVDPSTVGRDLLQPVWHQGRRVSAALPLSQVRERAQRNLAKFHGGIKRFVNPH